MKQELTKTDLVKIKSDLAKEFNVKKENIHIIEKPAPKKTVKSTVQKIIKKADAEQKKVQGTKCFPASIKAKIDGKEAVLDLVQEQYKTGKELEQAIDAGKQVFIACYWSRNLLKQFNYGQIFAVKDVSSFPNNLDLMQPIVFCEGLPKFHAVSIYTEAMIGVFDKELSEVIEGERFSAGMNFQLYQVR